jgi:hypothetical protein
MQFKEFFEEQTRLWPMVSYAISLKNQGFVQLCRIWNALAIMHPEKCEDVITMEMDGGEMMPVSTPNPYRDKAGKGKKKPADTPEPPTAGTEPDDVVQPNPAQEQVHETAQG